MGNTSNIIENGNYCVYIHTSPSGKRYVGQTGKTPEERWGKNGSHYLKKEKNGEYVQRYFAHAIIKYGWDNFDHEIIASNLTKEEADSFEKLLIDKLNTKNRNYGYNLKDGGIGGGGFSEETLKKMSESHKGKKQSEETIRKRAEKLRGKNNPNYGKPMSEEQKRKLSESLKGRKQSEETIRKRAEKLRGENNPNYGKPMNEELKKKLREINLGRKHSEETKKKISIATKGENNPFYGQRHSEESRKKMSESHKGQLIGAEHHNSKKIAQYDSLGILIRFWDCINDANREFNIDNAGISNCCRGIQKKAAGFIWRYADQELTEEHLTWCNELHSGGCQKKPIIQYSLDNKFICLFNSITEAGRKTGVDTGSISACCRGRQKTAGGFMWKYYNDENMKTAI